MLNLFRSFFDTIYPLKCGVCGSYGDVLCTECIENFTFVREGTSCFICGRWLSVKSICGECLSQEGIFERGVFGFYFTGRVRDAIHAFKFKGRKDVGKRLVSILRERISEFSDLVDAIIPVPVTERRLKERGYNQSFIIAEAISKIIKKSVYHNVLLKNKETKDQFSLTKEEREKNVRGVFKIRDEKKIEGKRILLVDDLYTTGHTAREAGRTILKAHPERIYLFALARTP